MSASGPSGPLVLSIGMGTSTSLRIQRVNKLFSKGAKPGQAVVPNKTKASRNTIIFSIRVKL